MFSLSRSPIGEAVVANFARKRLLLARIFASARRPEA